MIIFGTRMYGRKNEVRSHGRCPHCGRMGKQTSYDGRKWGHLYFIPIIPEGGRVRVFQECASCRKGMHVPIEKLSGIVEGLTTTMGRVVAATGAKETEVEIDGRRRPVAAVVNSVVGEVHCLLGPQEVVRFLDRLREARADEELVLAEAKAAETAGRTKEADGKYHELAGRSKNPVMLYQAARFLRDQARIAEAVAVAERLEMMAVTDLDVKQLLIDCYGAQREWAKLATAYENCFLIAPDLMKAGAIRKAYKKACKKAGREPQQPG